MFREAIAVARDVPDIEVAVDVENRTDIRIDVRGHCYCAADKNNQDEQRDFAAGEQRTFLLVVPHAKSSPRV